MGIQVTHDEYWVVLGVKQLQHSSQFGQGHCLSGQQASLHQAGFVGISEGRHIDGDQGNLKAQSADLDSSHYIAKMLPQPNCRGV